ncbi:glycosyl transferase [Bacteroidota bacterium]|nr:glycosyl transferase [Bacteroidota bacterium]
MAAVSIILVNYNTSSDTLECISSLLNNNFIDFNIIVVDNNSDIVNQNILIDFAQRGSKKESDISHHNQFAHLNDIIFYQIKNFNVSDFDNLNISEISKCRITILFNNENNGLAAANNIGMKLAKQLDSKFIWLLNNDVIIDSNALASLVKYFQDSNQNIGVVGSKVLFYDEPEKIQSIGGLFNPYTTKQVHIGYNEIDTGQFDNSSVSISYPYGASLFIKTEYYDKVGPINEEYFLYFEELDWIKKGNRIGYNSGYCFQSKVFHKQGKSTGKKLFTPRTEFIACLFCRNLLIFYKRHYPLLLPIAWSRLFLNYIKAIYKQNYGEAFVTLRVMFGFKNCLRYKTR